MSIAPVQIEVTTRPDIQNSQLVSEGNIETQTPLSRGGVFLSPLLYIDRADGVITAYSVSNVSGTLYIIFTDSSGKYVVAENSQATASSTVPTGSGLTSADSASLTYAIKSRYFYIFYANNAVTNQTFFELGWKSAFS